MSSILSRSTFPKTGESPFAPQNGGAKPIARRRTKSLYQTVQGKKGDIMNNEEKILEMLSKMQGDIAGIKETLEEVDQRSIRTQVLLEADISDKIQLLFDGHSTIIEMMDRLAPKERVEVLEDEIITLKTAVKMISNRLAALEKAQ